MSIDAIVENVEMQPDGTCDFLLVAADDRRAPAGQRRITILNPKPRMDYFIGEYIWGGACELMIGQVKFAERIGYTRARLV